MVSYVQNRVSTRQTAQWLKRVALITFALCLMQNVQAGEHEKGHGHMTDSERKSGILLVTFGTTNEQARKAFENIEQQAKERFPDTEIRWGYTSHMIRNILAKQGVHIKSPVSALAEMHDDGFTHVAVQSLHVIAGEEYNQLKDTVQAYRGAPFNFKQLTLGQPLLASYNDVHEVCKAMLAQVPEKRSEDDAVIFVGHGSHHPAGLSYVATASVLNAIDTKAFLGAVEGHPTRESVIERCQQSNAKKVWLMPLMSVAGDHARNDMAGDSDDAWQSVLEQRGFECETVLKGMGEYDNVVKVWLDHLEEAKRGLDEE